MRHIALIILLLLPIEADAFPRGGAESNSSTSYFGLNIGGLASGGSVLPGVAGTNFYVPTDANMDYYHSKNENFVRLPFLWERVQPVLGGALDTTYLGYIQATAAKAAARGMTVLLDVHNFGGYCYPAHSVCGSINGVGGPTIAQYADLWSRLATAFVGNTAIAGYDLMNEPNGMPTANTVPDMYQSAVTAIRLIDTATPIYLEGDAYASAYGWFGDCANCGGAPIGGWNPGGNLDLLNVIDPNDNLVYSAHDYADSDGSGSYPNGVIGSPNYNPLCPNNSDTYQCAVAKGNVLTTPTSAITTDILVQRDAPFVTRFCAIYKKKCHIGETGWPRDNSNWNTTGDKHLAFLQTNNTKFSYWNADGTTQNYLLNVDPQIIACETNGTTCVDNAPQAVLTKYTNAYLPTNYQLTGPSRGSAGVASSNFTVAYYGYIRSAITIIPDDGGRGGTFTPTSLTFSPGFNGSGTFTYTAPGTDVYAISTTASSSTLVFTNPPSLGYATIADEFSTSGLSNSQIINVLSMCRIYGPYVGNVFTLRRSSDDATANFGFTDIHLNSCVDQSAITAWAAGSNVYVVNWYDQGPNANNATPPTADGTAITSPITNADQPQLVLNCQNSLPCLLWSSNRMEANSPFGGTPAQTILAVVNPTVGSPFNYQTQNNFAFLGWPLASPPQTDTIGALSGDLSANSDMASSTQLRSYTVGSGWNAIGASWGTSVGGTLISNGTIVNRVPVGGHSAQTPYRNYMTLGFQPFSGVRFAGKTQELIRLNTSLLDANITNFNNDEISRYGLTPPAYSYYPPSLNQSTTLENSPPWYGVNGTDQYPGFATPPDATYAYWATKGANIYRHLVVWELIQPNLCTGNTSLNAAELVKLDHAIDVASAAGMDILIDLHNFGQYNYSYSSTCASPPDDGYITHATTQGYFVNYWTQIAARYSSGGSHPNLKVKFDIMNEPAEGHISDAQMMVAAQAVINSVRGAGYNNYIFVEFSTASSSCNKVASNGGPAFAALVDASNRTVLDCHLYLTNCGFDGCVPVSDQNQGTTNFAAGIAYVKNNHQKLFWGEAGAAAYTPSMYAETKAALELINANIDAGAGGTVGYVIWGIGTWGETYPFKQDQWTYTGTPGNRLTSRLLNTEFTQHVWPATQTFQDCYTNHAPCTVNFP